MIFVLEKTSSLARVRTTQIYSIWSTEKKHPNNKQINVKIMKAKFFYVFLLVAFFVGLSGSVFSQSGSGYDYVVEAGADFTLLADDYGSEITIGVPNGGDFELYAPVGSSGQQWTTENCGNPGGSQITTCGSGTYALVCNQGTIGIEIIWYFEFGQLGVDTMYVSTGDPVQLTLNNGNFDGVWLYDANTNYLGVDNVSVTPVLGTNLYVAEASDEAAHVSKDSLRIIYTTSSVYTATFTVTESGTGTAITTASVTCNGSTQAVDGSGQTVFADLEDGDYPYSVTAAGYVTANGNITINGNNETPNVALTPLSNENDFLTFSFTEQTGNATINATNHTADIEVANGTDLTNLIATFTLS